MTRQPTLFGKAPRRAVGRVRRGLDDTLKAMRETGRIEKVDAALIALCRVAADELDAASTDSEESRYTRGTLTARYHDVLTHLLARGPADDGLTLDRLFAEVVDAP